VCLEAGHDVMDRPYSRLYHELAEEYPEVWDSPLLADYSRLLSAADQSWPVRARWAGHTTKRALASLSSIGAEDGRGALVVVDGTRYVIKGMEKERAGRSDAARYAINKRWEQTRTTDSSTARISDRTTETIPRRDETRQDETRRDKTRQGEGVWIGDSLGPARARTQPDAP